MDKFSNVVIGGGPGGRACAKELAQRGLSVALIEKNYPGGKAINQGYFVSKVFLEGAKNDNVETKEDFAEIVKLRKQTAQTSWKMDLEKAGVKVYSREASLQREDPQIINLKGGEDKQRVAGERIILATGSKPISPLNFALNPQKNIISYQELLSGDYFDLDKIAILGGDVEGCEFATLYQNLTGVEVYLIEQQSRLLPNCDSELARILTEKLALKGVRINTNSTIKDYQLKDNNLKLQGKNLTTKEDFQLEVDVLLVTGGAEAYLPAGSENLGFQLNDEGFVEVKEDFATSVPGFYALGDLIGGITSANAAIMEGKALAARIAGHELEVDYRNLPFVFFTDPLVTGIGWREDDLNQDLIKKEDIVVKKAKFTENLRALTRGEGDGLLKLIISQRRKTILGAQAIGPGGEELQPLLTLLVSQQIPLEEISKLPLAHPSLAELILQAVNN